MALARVQAVNAQGTATSTPNASITVTAGDLIVVCVSMNDTVARTVTGVSDGVNTWHQVTGAANSNSTKSADMWWTVAQTSATLTITVTVSASTCDTALTVVEVSGNDTSSPFDVAISANGSGTAPASGNTAATAQANEFLVALVANALAALPTGQTFSPSVTNQTNEAESREATAPVANLAVSDALAGAAAAQSYSATQNSGSWICICAAFKAPAAGVLAVGGQRLPGVGAINPRAPRVTAFTPFVAAIQQPVPPVLPWSQPPRDLRKFGKIPFVPRPIATNQQFTQQLTAGLSFTGPTNLTNLIGTHLSGALSFTGPTNLKNAISKTMTAGLSFTGAALKNAINKTLVAAGLSFAGALQRAISTHLSGGLSFSGAVTSSHLFLKTITGGLSFTGPTNLLNAISKTVTGGLSFTGAALQKAIGKTMTAGLSFTGPTNLKNAITKGLASAALSFAGAINMRTSKTLGAAGLSFSGAMTSSHIHLTTLTGALSFTGALARQVAKTVTGSLSFSGAQIRVIGKHMTAQLSFTGAALSNRVFIHLNAALSFSGAIARQFPYRLQAAALSFSGALTPLYQPVFQVFETAIARVRTGFAFAVVRSGGTVARTRQGIATARTRAVAVIARIRTGLATIKIRR